MLLCNLEIYFYCLLDLYCILVDKMLVIFLMGYFLFLEFLFIIYRSYMYVVFMVGVERVF